MLKSLWNFCSGVCPLCHGSSPLGRFCQTCTDAICSQRNHPYRCSHCQLALPSNHHCPNCEEHTLSLGTIYHAFDYVPPLDSLVLKFKNAQQVYLAQAFAELIAQQLHAQNITLHHKLLVPISSSTEQLRKRNYNPAGVFAKALAKKLQCALDLSVLRRQSSTQLQKSLSRHDRFLHSSQLYYAHRRLSHNTSIVLVDDILTTGSTLESAARALISAGARQVDAIVIARTANPF